MSVVICLLLLPKGLNSNHSLLQFERRGQLSCTLFCTGKRHEAALPRWIPCRSSMFFLCERRSNVIISSFCHEFHLHCYIEEGKVHFEFNLLYRSQNFQNINLIRDSSAMFRKLKLSLFS